MKAALIAAVALSILYSPAALAKGSGGGHGGGHGGGQSGGHSATHGTHASGGAHSGTAQHPGAVAAHERGTRPTIGTAVPRSGATDLFRATPFTYAPVYVPRYRVFGFGHASYYNSLWPIYSIGSAYEISPCATSDCLGLPEDTYAAAAAEPEPIGNLRVDVQPMSAQIFVDGYFVGTVDDFYHTLAGLSLSPGAHRLEFRAPGYATLTVDVLIEANRTITYRGTLQKE